MLEVNTLGRFVVTQVFGGRMAEAGGEAVGSDGGVVGSDGEDVPSFAVGGRYGQRVGDDGTRSVEDAAGRTRHSPAYATGRSSSRFGNQV